MSGNRNRVERKKVLLMGKSGAGKTSMRSIIFANYMANDVQRLGVTMEIEHAHVRMLGNLTVNLWDCGGQDTFMENYFIHQKENIFSGASVLIYVLDIKSEKPDADLEGYRECLKAISDYGAEGHKIFALVHKMDLIENIHERNLKFEQKRVELEKFAAEHGCQVDCSKTSIWDKTLYSAWSRIVTQLVPNRQKLQQELNNFVKLSEADEVMLFEKNTYLNLCYVNRSNPSGYNDGSAELAEKMEELSHHMKSFKTICYRNATSYKSVEIKNSRNSIIMSEFTEYTIIMLISYNPDIPLKIWRENILRVKPRFDRLDAKKSR